ncbi:MAG: hypothetical protein QOD77_1089 [Thermoplasmata archaeon]|jgi:CheY-like chemotaxis protein|nr:hypothetical protein [Thermoplasmata archaeon]
MLVEFRRRSDGGPPTVLLVDDEPDILESLQSYLQATLPGVRILVAANAAAALPLVSQADVIVSDLRMPGMDGLELLTRVRRKYPLVRRILITAFQEPSLEDRAAQAGVGAVLRKPFELNEFRETVTEALGS